MATDNRQVAKKIVRVPDLEVREDAKGLVFKAWGTCFNELGWDALQLLPTEQQSSVLNRLFSPEGDLRFTLGRIPINANDYARDWYSCDEVAGDFQLNFFNIDRDQTTLIPFIKAAQQHNPELTFWVSPWSPPTWMKVNQYYSVRSDRKQNQMSPLSDVLLFEDQVEKDPKVFPQRLAVNDYFIQAPRYLKAYANYFCKFISAYQEQGIPITKSVILALIFGNSTFCNAQHRPPEIHSGEIWCDTDGNMINAHGGGMLWAYHVCSSENNATLYISLLTADYLKPSVIYTRNFIGLSREVPAVFKRQGKHYILSSGCTGWSPNQAEWAVADSMLGTWSRQGNPCRGKDAEITFFSQSTHVLPVTGRPGNYIAMFDRWSKTNLDDSRYVWLPISFNGDTPEIHWQAAWRVEDLP